MASDTTNYFIAATPGQCDQLLNFLRTSCNFTDLSMDDRQYLESANRVGYQFTRAMFQRLTEVLDENHDKNGLLMAYVRKDNSSPFLPYTSTSHQAA